jgi:hypothetical protein
MAMGCNTIVENEYRGVRSPICPTISFALASLRTTIVFREAKLLTSGLLELSKTLPFLYSLEKQVPFFQRVPRGSEGDADKPAAG